MGNGPCDRSDPGPQPLTPPCLSDWSGVGALPRPGAAFMSAPIKQTPVTIFSDFTCPYSFIMEAALWSRMEAGVIKVTYRAYELYPAPLPAPSPAGEPGWHEAVAPLAAELGITISVPSYRPRTAKAHEAAYFAAERGLATPLRRALFTAYWSEQVDIGRIDVITRTAAEVGIDAEELRIALDIDMHREQALRDREIADRLRVPGAPTLFIGTGHDARVLIGAHPASALDEALAGR